MVGGYAYLVIPVAVGIAAAYVMASGLDAPDSGGEDLRLTPTALTHGGSPVLGSPSAPITILEWGDYQCTFCLRFHDSTLGELEREYIDTGVANLVFKDFPLNGPDSVLAAEASHCAAEQKRYWEYHSMIYANWAGERTGWITRDLMDGLAESAGLDAAAFGQCMDSHRTQGHVLDLEEFGRSIGVDATPTFFVFDDERIIKIRGSQPPDVFRQVIADLQRG